MNVWEALSLAAAVTLLCFAFLGEKLLEVNVTGLLPRNWKRAKYKRLLAPGYRPLENKSLRKDIRQAFETILLPLAAADRRLLPARMDLHFRRRIERQVELLAQQRLRREIRLTDIVPLPKNNFVRWNDDGREWREAVLQCSALERFVPAAGGQPVREIYRKNARLRVLQSRHIRHSDRTEKKSSYYADKLAISCPSCGAEIRLDSQQVVCPYCGGVIQSDFYDWQTEAFELYEEIGTALRKFLLLLAASSIQFVCLFLCLWLIQDTQISLTAGVGVTLLVLAAIFAAVAHSRNRPEKLAEEIVRYSENYLRSCINEALYQKIPGDLMDYSVGTIVLKKVSNTEETTTITARVYIRETCLPPGKKPYTRKYARTLTLQRARYPQRRKAKGSFFAEKECPSCGANFVPDANHCCSFCGYGLQIVNSQWTLLADKPTAGSDFG